MKSGVHKRQRRPSSQPGISHALIASDRNEIVKRIRLIALYLPQFHPIPENDAWWGKGFTEWTNTAKAKPLFPGHQQPNVPADLGFCDLRVSETRRAQAELARQHGIEGFCYWHYWFGKGKQLLERPFREVVTTGEPDFPFCLAWANQTWSGVWHGSPERTLIEQTYDGPEDHVRHFHILLDAFRDPRYMKIDGRNIFCVFRPQDIQDSQHFIDTWQQLAVEEGVCKFYFIGIANYPWTPSAEGYDAWMTNPPVPMLTNAQHVQRLNEEIERGIYPPDSLSKDRLPLPQIYSYRDFVDCAFPQEVRQSPFLPCVVPRWDNTPRSGDRGFVLHDSTPELYAKHLEEAISLVRHNDDDNRVIFIKSWNEWAESNFLEPDLRWGRRYLEATARAVEHG